MQLDEESFSIVNHNWDREYDVLLRAQVEQEEREAEIAERRRAAEAAKTKMYRSWVSKFDHMGLVGLQSAKVEPLQPQPLRGLRLCLFTTASASLFILMLL